MGRSLIFFILFAFPSLAETESSLKGAYALLARSELGASELKKARELNISIVLGSVSKTDITATRVMTGKLESYQFVARVIVDQNKEPVFQAMDLAHELTHATESKSNPFDPGLTVEAYIEHGIESSGGEAQAIANECQVGKELTVANWTSHLSDETVKLIQSRCQFVWKTVDKPDEWKHSFYDLGQYYREFMKKLVELHGSPESELKWVEKVDNKNPVFASAVAHKPYPLALLEEYVTITQKVCERAQKASQGRSVASLELLKDRCAQVKAEVSP